MGQDKLPRGDLYLTVASDNSPLLGGVGSIRRGRLCTLQFDPAKTSSPSRHCCSENRRRPATNHSILSYQSLSGGLAHESGFGIAFVKRSMRTDSPY